MTEMSEQHPADLPFHRIATARCNRPERRSFRRANLHTTVFVDKHESSTTHTVNTDPRRIPLISTIPSDPGMALGEYWMLFVMNIAGVPPKAVILKLN